MNEKNITQPTVQRLAFIKYLFNVAVEQSRQPEPLSAASILTFHDSIELFLCLAYEHLGVNINNKTTFLGHWEMLKPKLSGEGLTQKTAMSRLDASRGNLKHKGLLPHKQDIEELRASAMSFFIDNTPLVFGIDFEKISLVDLVTYEIIRARLQKAEKLKEKGDIEKALIEIAIAFEQLIDEYEASILSNTGYSPFYFGKDMLFGNSLHMGLYNNAGINSRFPEFIDDLKDSVSGIRYAIKILSLGFDYRRYTRFKLSTPEVLHSENVGYGYRIVRKPNLSSENYDFCFNFVIERAIHLQEFDFEIKS